MSEQPETSIKEGQLYYDQTKEIFFHIIGRYPTNTRSFAGKVYYCGYDYRHSDAEVWELNQQALDACILVPEKGDRVSWFDKDWNSLFQGTVRDSMLNRIKNNQLQDWRPLCLKMGNVIRMVKNRESCILPQKPVAVIEVHKLTIMTQGQTSLADRIHESKHKDVSMGCAVDEKSKFDSRGITLDEVKDFIDNCKVVPRTQFSDNNPSIFHVLFPPSLIESIFSVPILIDTPYVVVESPILEFVGATIVVTNITEQKDVYFNKIGGRRYMVNDKIFEKMKLVPKIKAADYYSKSGAHHRPWENASLVISSPPKSWSYYTPKLCKKCGRSTGCMCPPISEE